MKQRKMYRYVGKNGVITSPILLEDIKHIALIELQPEPGYVLTNGQIIKNYSALIPIEELPEWTEVKADTIE